jgi:hypothetical protein
MADFDRLDLITVGDQRRCWAIEQAAKVNSDPFIVVDIARQIEAYAFGPPKPELKDA